MKHVIVDTNGFLRFLLDDIPEQKRIFEKLLQKAKSKQIIILVPEIIIFEIDFILRKYYQFEKKDIIEKLESLLSANFFYIESKVLFQTALTIYKTESISFVDSFLLARAKIEEVELFTFDQKLKKLK